MTNKLTEISLDKFILELDPVIDANHRFLWLVKAKVTFPSGDVLTTGFRYDTGKNWIIDPLVQKSRDYVQPEEETFLRLASHDYVATVSERVSELIQNGELRLRYDNREGTLKDYQRHNLQTALDKLDQE